jgi:hypothetical protein
VFIITNPQRRVGNRGVAPHIRNFCALKGRQRYTLCTYRCIRMERASNIHRTESLVNSRTGLEVETKRTVFGPTENQNQTVRPLASHCTVAHLSCLL